jgi:hypothetical protein
MKRIFLVLLAAAFVVSGSGVLMAATVSVQLAGKKQPSPPKNDVKSAPKPDSKPCVDKGCQLGTPQVVR